MYLQLELFLETEIKLSTFIFSRVELLNFDSYSFPCIFTSHKFKGSKRRKENCHNYTYLATNVEG